MVIENNVNGILVPVRDEVALYEGMKKILMNNDFAEALGREAYKIRNRYPIKDIAEQWVSVLYID